MPVAVHDPGAAPTIASVLDTLPQPRLLDLFRLFGADMRDPSTSKERLVFKLAHQLRGGMPALLKELGRDELRAACRRHASFVLVVCPASVCLQWRDEMQRRLGLRFELMTRQFVGYRRQERGFGTNPWSTYNRFISSHSLLRRPEYRDPLLVHLGDRAQEPATQRDLSEGKASDLVLSEKLARSTELCAPASGRGRLPFIHLQQRLLSSPEAFARSIEGHAKGLEKKGGPVAAPVQRKLDLEDGDPEAHGVSDEAIDEEREAAMQTALQAASAELPSPTEEARSLLSEMRAIAEKARRVPDAKVLALLDWLRDNVCPAVVLPVDTSQDRSWGPRRVILFTEYADTKRYLVDLLTQAFAHTDDGDSRIRVFHGGMDDDARDEVQRAFNRPPDQDPVRILVATDAAREGVNLQAHRADLFHIDIPWNPARLEQRNGRTDRTLQPADEVRCHYFLYPQRSEDHVIETVIRKVVTVKRELGSLGTVLLHQVEKTLENGISVKTKDAVAGIGTGAKATNVDDELEAQRKDLRSCTR